MDKQITTIKVIDKLSSDLFNGSGLIR